MAILDAQAKFSVAQAITASAVSALTIDKLAKGEGLDEPLYLVVRVNTLFASADGTATLQVQLQTSDTVSAGALSGTVVTLLDVPAQAISALVAGHEILKVRMPPGQHRYVALNYIVGTENFTAGAIDAFLTPDAETATQTLRPVI